MYDGKSREIPKNSLSCLIPISAQEVVRGLRQLCQASPLPGPDQTPKLFYIGGFGDNVKIPSILLEIKDSRAVVFTPWGSVKTVNEDQITVPSRARSNLQKAAWALYEEVSKVFDTYSSSLMTQTPSDEAKAPKKRSKTKTSCPKLSDI